MRTNKKEEMQVYMKEIEHTLLLVLEEPNIDKIHTLLKRECEYVTSATLVEQEDQPKFASQGVVHNQLWRSKIFAWFYKIIDHFDYDREIVAIAIDLLDRFQILSRDDTSSFIDGEKYQLAAMTSLYIAIKINCTNITKSNKIRKADSASSPVAKNCKAMFPLRQYVHLSRDAFTLEDFLAMELKILMTLRWKVNPVIPTDYLMQLLYLFNDRVISSIKSTDSNNDTLSAALMRKTHYVLTIIYELTRYLIEVAITSVDICFYFDSGGDHSPSILCLGAILQCMDWISEDYISDCHNNDFEDTALHLLQIEEQPALIEDVKCIIQRCVLSHQILDGGLSASAMKDKVENLHPFKMLREAKVLCLESQHVFMKSLINVYSCASNRSNHICSICSTGSTNTVSTASTCSTSSTCSNRKRKHSTSPISITIE